MSGYDGDEVIRRLLLPKFDQVQRRSGYWMVQCPAHDDQQASLSVQPGEDQPVVFNCHAGCQTTDILNAIGVSWADVCGGKTTGEGEPGAWTPHGDALAVYDYVDAGGLTIYQVLRAPGKKFIQRRPDSSKKSGWAYKSVAAKDRVLYRLPQVIEAVESCAIVYVVEGEKDVHTLERLGQVGTCNAGGAGKWLDQYSEYLRDAIVVIVADRDDPGYAHARQVAASLRDIAQAVEIVEPADGKDLTDHVEAGKTLAELVLIWTDDDPPMDLAPDLINFLMVQDPPLVYALGDLLAMGERLIVTGPEGFGKTTMLRQCGICAAVGLHPFMHNITAPIRVLQIDCENSERQSRQAYRPLVARAGRDGHELRPGMFRILVRPRGIDLASEDGCAWLLERVTAHEPQLLIIGSLWKMHRGDLNDESAARQLTDALDQAVDKAGCALIVEAHSPHESANGRRPTRPAGSSLFRRWPEFGMCLMPAVKQDPDDPARFQLKPWRGGRDRTQLWPRKLIPGIPGGWPWIAEPSAQQIGGFGDG